MFQFVGGKICINVYVIFDGLPRVSSSIGFWLWKMALCLFTRSPTLETSKWKCRAYRKAPNIPNPLFRRSRMFNFSKFVAHACALIATIILVFSNTIGAQTPDNVLRLQSQNAEFVYAVTSPMAPEWHAEAEAESLRQGGRPVFRNIGGGFQPVAGAYTDVVIHGGFLGLTEAHIPRTADRVTPVESLGGVTVTVNGLTAKLTYVSRDSIRVLMPADLEIGMTYAFVVRVKTVEANGTTDTPYTGFLTTGLRSLGAFGFTPWQTTHGGPILAAWLYIESPNSSRADRPRQGQFLKFSHVNQDGKAELEAIQFSSDFDKDGKLSILAYLTGTFNYAKGAKGYADEIKMTANGIQHGDGKAEIYEMSPSGDVSQIKVPMPDSLRAFLKTQVGKVVHFAFTIDDTRITTSRTIKFDVLVK